MGRRSKKFAKISYKQSLQTCIDTGVPFKDPDFEATERSLFSDRSFLVASGLTSTRITWKRPLELTRDPRLLFREKVRSCRWQLVMCDTTANRLDPTSR